MFVDEKADGEPQERSHAGVDIELYIMGVGCLVGAAMFGFFGYTAYDIGEPGLSGGLSGAAAICFAHSVEYAIALLKHQ